MLELHHCKCLLCYYELLNLRATSWYVVYVVRGSGCVVRGSGTGYVVSLLVLGTVVRRTTTRCAVP